MLCIIYSLHGDNRLCMKLKPMQGIVLLITLHAGLHIASRTLQKNALCNIEWKITQILYN